LILEGVRFAYQSGPLSLRRDRVESGDRLVLDGFDLEIDPGEFTWIAGRNGAGKSTLIKLLAGIESPQAGRILVPASWREPAVAYLPQRAFLDSDWTRWAREYVGAQPAAWKTLDAILGLEGILSKADALAGIVRRRAPAPMPGPRVSHRPRALPAAREPTTWLDRGKIANES